jgi:aspartyl-tRNA(Asn)/glutamyl-tRNA(Gln) amidotransferase subunit A
MNKALNELTLREVVRGITDQKFSAAEVQQSVLTAIKVKNPDLNAYLDYHNELPTAVAAGSLLGAPIAVKDNFLTTDLITTASSNVLRGYRPQYESTVTTKLRKAGAYLIGKTNLDAWAHGSSTETSDFGPTHNPNNPEYMPGGSSGGSAAAVAADLCTAAIGSETAGSIRQPSGWCGTVGLKPTYGRVSRYGVVAMGSSLDCPGPITKTVADSALLLNLIAGHDPYDGTTSPQAAPDFTQSLDQSVRGLKIGVLYLDVPGLEPVRDIYRAQIEVLRQLGATVTETTAMDPQIAIGLYAVIQRSEVSSNLARYDGIRYGQDRSTFGAEAKRRIMIGTYTLSKGYADKYYVLAQKVRTLFIRDYERLFAEFDVVISPSAPGYALKLGESAKYPYFGELMDMLLEPSSIAGLPGINVPCYRDPASNLPLGLNIMAAPWQEAKVIQVAHAFEQATNWNRWAVAEREGNV